MLLLSGQKSHLGSANYSIKVEVWKPSEEIEQELIKVLYRRIEKKGPTKAHELRSTLGYRPDLIKSALENLEEKEVVKIRTDGSEPPVESCSLTAYGEQLARQL
jgi:DNA-binding HxlR family transcriptional regulator